MSEQLIKPNFLIVGAAKSGTTSLWYYLSQHPDIFMARPKELKFLSSAKISEDSNILYKFQYICDCTPINCIEDYFNAFCNVNAEEAVGEASTHYLFTYESTIPVIKKHIGNPKIIIILRDPVERAFSSYRHTTRNDPRAYHFNETRSFEECLELDEIHRMKNETLTMMHYYKSVGFYYHQVKAYLENFSHVKVYLYDDLSKNPKNLIRDIYSFLEVDPNFSPDINLKMNVSLPDKNLLQKTIFSHKMRKLMAPLLFSLLGESNSIKLYNFVLKQFRKDEMKSETRQYLINLYREDILKLQDLIQRDLSHWLDSTGK